MMKYRNSRSKQFHHKLSQLNTITNWLKKHKPITPTERAKLEKYIIKFQEIINDNQA